MWKKKRLPKRLRTASRIASHGQFPVSDRSYSGLAENKSLERLRLVSAEVGDKGIHAMKRGLGQNSSLHTLVTEDRLLQLA